MTSARAPEKRLKLLAGALGAFALALSAGGPAAAKELRFGLSSAGLSYPFAAAIAKGFQDAARRAGAQAVVLDAQGQVQKQANDIDDLVALKVDGVAIMPLDSVVAKAWVDKAVRAGEPVVAVGSLIGDPHKRPTRDVYPALVALVTQDEVAAGEAAGELARGLLPKGRVARIAVVEGAAGFPEVLQRLQGFRQALDHAGVRYRIVASQPGDWTAEKAEAVCQNMLAAHPDIDLFFNEADDMAVGCAHAARISGSNARLIGIGGSKLAVAAIKAGRLDGTVCYKPEALGALTFDALYRAAVGHDPRKGAFVTYRTPGVTRATVSQCVGQW